MWQERRTGFWIAAVFGEVEMHLAYEIPGWITALEDSCKGQRDFRQFGPRARPMERHREARTSAAEVFGSRVHRRRSAELRQFRGIGLGVRIAAPSSVPAARGAEGGGEPSSEIPPPG